jgi:hypothetical protein
MPTWTNPTKNSSTFSALSKNSALFTNTSKTGVSWNSTSRGAFLAYILTDANDKILVGENEDLYLVWNTETKYTNQSKNTAVFTNITKS